MALSCSSLSLGSSSTTPTAAPLSSASSTFLTSSASARMLTPPSHTPLRMRPSVTCSLDSDQDANARRSTSHAILTGLLATGAALSFFVADIVTPAPAHAFFGPFNGRAGEEAVAKSKDILKRADKLDDRGVTGPGKVSGTASNSAAPGTLSQKVATAIRDDSGKRTQNVFGTGGNALQDAGSKIANTLGDKKGDLKNAADNVVGQVKGITNSGDLKGTADKAVGQTKSKADNVIGQVMSKKGDLKSAADNAVGEVKGINNSGDLKGAANKAVGQTKGKADNVIGQAKSKADDVVGMAKSKANDVAGGNPASGILSSIKEGVQGFKESVVQNSSDARNAAGDAANKVQSSVQ